MTRIPGHTSIARAICCYFSANRFDYHETFRVYRWFAVEMTALIAKHADVNCVAPLRTTLAEVLETHSDELSLLHVSAIEDAFFELADNPILNLFLRSTKAFPCWAGYREAMPAPTQQHLRELLENIDATLAAVQAGDPALAAAIQERNLLAVDNWRTQHLQSLSQAGVC
jgi:DNA-binding GntR family transcriptional regulator